MKSSGSFWLPTRGGGLFIAPIWNRGTWGHGVLSAEATVELREVLRRPWSVWQWPLILGPMWDREER